MIPRFSRPEMTVIWEDENKFKIWLEIEMLVCEAQAGIGVIPKDAPEKIRAQAGFDIKRIDEIEKEVRHDVIAFLTNVGEHVGDEAAFDRSLLSPATRHDIVVRMLVNLKRLYVRMRSFPQARFISSLLLAADPSAISELRDRGLLAYHLQDFAAALHDLEEYLRLVPKSAEPGEHDLLAEHDDEDDDAEPSDDATEIWEHVKTLRKRVASFN